METSLPFFLSIFSISFFFFFTHTASGVSICPPASCDETGPEIRFPFRIRDFQPYSCEFPGFDLSCNNSSKTILTLPFSGDFIVDKIDYSNQWIYVNDQDSCFPKRVLNFSLVGSRFKQVYSRDYTFFNCSAADWPEYIMPESVPVFCLGSRNFTVIALDSIAAGNGSMPPVCKELLKVSSPVELSAVNPIGNVQLRWKMPICSECEAAGGTCGYTDESGSAIGCLNLPTGDSPGLPRSAKYGIIIGVGIPGLVCLIGLVCYALGKFRKYHQRRRLDAQLSTLAINSQPMAIITGLDRPTIESYPKTVVGESRRLPRPNDGTCPICLAEYEPKETLRTIPECNHYFHAKCVDEWLRLNSSCPLCRNTPAESFVVTPSSSVSSTPAESSVITPSSSISSSSTS